MWDSPFKQLLDLVEFDGSPVRSVQSVATDWTSSSDCVSCFVVVDGELELIPSGSHVWVGCGVP